MIQKILTTLKILLNKKTKLVFVFNFHRIGIVNKKIPFHILHTIRLGLFKIQIQIFSLFGKFISISVINEYENLSKINFSITFDEGSRTILRIVPYLRKRSIPGDVLLR